MKKTNQRTSSSMKSKLLTIVIAISASCFIFASSANGQDRIPREYTNPDEVVTFDRSTSFSRAIDVINQFAQDFSGKLIIDRTNTESNLGISVPPMHWRDALDLILRVKYLQLVEQAEYFEIVSEPSTAGQGQNAGQATTTVPDTALSTDSKEIRINAIFFEGNRRALQEIGVDWSTLTENVPGSISQFVNPQQGGGGGGSGGDGGGGGGGAGGGQGQGQLPDVGNFDGPFVSVNSKGAQSVSQNVFSSLVNFGDVFGSGISVQALFSAFEADNLGEILSSPSVKVLEGEQGRIQVGQDFSIKQRDFAGNVTDEFFSVGTILNVVPQVIEYQDTTFIHLDIEAERSSAQPDPVSTIIQKQNATTQALLLDNEATVMAGLYRTEASEVRRGVPILKDLPGWFFGLKYIFGYNSKDYQTRELVILIQASIEPGIRERLQKDKLRNKFDVLEDERKRIQDEIKRYRETGDGVAPVKGEIDDSGEVLDEPGSRKETSDAENKIEKERNEELANKVEALQKELQQAQTNIKEYREDRNEDRPPAKDGENAVVRDEKMAETESATTIEEEDKQSKVQPTNQEQAAKNETMAEVEPVREQESSMAENNVQKESDSRDKPATEKIDKGNEPTAKKSEAAPQKAAKRNNKTPNKLKPVDDSAELYPFYLIAASFESQENAEEYRQNLVGDGYEAQLLKKENSRYFMVAYSGYSSWRSVKSTYDQIVQNSNEDAWVYQNNK